MAAAVVNSSLYYSSNLLNILTAVAVTGLVAFLFPKGELPAYITLIFSVALAFIFVMAQVSRRTSTDQTMSSFSKILSIFSHSYPTIILIILLFFLALIFASYKHNIYDIEPPAEFTAFKWTSYILLTFQIVILFKYLKDELLNTGTTNTSTNKLLNMLMSNLKNVLNVFSLINALIIGFIYVIISKFTTDG
jgi:hypothetical protein